MEERTRPDRGPASSRGIAAAIGVLGAALLVAYTLRYPPEIGVTLPVAALPDPLRMARAVWALLLLGVIGVAAHAIGLGARRLLRLPAGGRAIDLEPAATFGLGLLILSQLVLLLAALHCLWTPVLVLLVLVPATARAAAVWRGLRLWLEGNAGPSSERWVWVAGALLLLAPLLEALGPEVGWDALTYHLALPERTLASNGLFVTPFSAFSAFPGNMEMLYVLALGLEGDLLAKLLNLQLGVLTLFLLVRLGRRFSARCARWAPFFLMAEPLFMDELAWAYNDLMTGFYGLLCVALVMSWCEERRRSDLVLAGLFAGACIGTRYAGGAVLLSLCTALLLRPGGRGLRANGGAALVLVALVALVAAPWLLRNLLFTGNPVAPVLQGWLQAPGAEYFDPVALSQYVAFVASIGMGRDLVSWLMLPWNLTMETRPGDYLESFGFRLGPLHLLGVAAALPMLWLTRRREVSFLLVFAGVFTTLWFLTFQEARYLLPVFPVLALIGAWAFDELTRRVPSWRSSLLLLPVYALLLCQLPLLADLGRRFAFAFQLPDSPPPAGVAGRHLRATLGPDDRLALLAESRSYFFRGIDTVPYQPLEGPPLLQWIHARGDVEQLHCGLLELGVTHVLLNTRTLSVYQPQWVEGYGAQEYRADLQRISDLLADRTWTIYAEDGVRVGALRAAPSC